MRKRMMVACCSFAVLAVIVGLLCRLNADRPVVLGDTSLASVVAGGMDTCYATADSRCSWAGACTIKDDWTDCVPTDGTPAGNYSGPFDILCNTSDTNNDFCTQYHDLYCVLVDTYCKHHKASHTCLPDGVLDPPVERGLRWHVNVNSDPC